jgi:hypothetical protein
MILMGLDPVVSCRVDLQAVGGLPAYDVGDEFFLVLHQ